MDIAIVGAAGTVGRTIAQIVVEERLLQCDEKLILVGNPEGASAKHLGRKRVTGMGSFLDSLRFRKEIAQDLGVRNQSIHGFMVGEHGFNPTCGGTGHLWRVTSPIPRRLRWSHSLRFLSGAVCMLSDTGRSNFRKGQ